MKLEVITIGSELLLGQIVDTNAAELGRALAGAGAEVVRHLSVADRPEAIRAAVSESLQRTGFVITTGGLGPTRDDMTKLEVAALFGKPLRLDEGVLRSLEERFRRLGRPMPAVNRTQAEVPEGATVLPNPRGTAPGLWVEDGHGRVVVMLPVDLVRDEVVLIRQFRLGGQLALGKGDMVEVPAGRVERGEDVREAARCECQEEIGIVPQVMVQFFDLMPSAGASDEHMFFFLAVVDSSKTPARAGAAHEQEDTRPLCVPIERAVEALKVGELHYGAAVIALQWLALNRGRLREIVQEAAAR